MRAMRYAAPIVLLLASCAPEAPAPPQSPTTTQAPSSLPPTANPTLPPSSVAAPGPLGAMAAWLVDRIHGQESQKDATCWTTVRQMESFYASMPTTRAAQVLKIESTRALVYRVWREASRRAGDAEMLGEGALEAALPAPIHPDTPPSPRVARVLLDHQKITENWRSVFSIVTDALAGVGLFERRAVDLRPLSPEAAERLTEAATRISLMLLEAAQAAAVEANHRWIDVPNVQAAYTQTARALGLPDDLDGPATPVAPASDEARAALRALTLQNMDRKIASLAAWNKATPERFDKDVEILNRYGPTPWTEDGARALFEQVQRVAAFASAGVSPQRSDAELDNLARAVRPGTTPPEHHLTLAWMSNAIEQLFPHRTLNNGDLMVYSRFEVPPDQIIDHNVQLWHSDLDAARDLQVHWRMARAAWGANAQAATLDPFAAELLTERLSELWFYWCVLYHQAATRTGATRIDAAFVRSPGFSGHLFNAPPRGEEGPELQGWRPTPDERAAFERAHPGPTFRDVTAQSGLPLQPLVRYAPVALPDDAFDIHDKMGAGIGVGDYDDDGRPDLYLAGEGGNRLYRNLGGLRFQDVTTAVGLGDPALKDARQPLLADLDGDGRLDLLALHSAGPTRLWLQRAPGRFVEAPASETGLSPGPGAHTVTLLDYDLDGRLDVYVGTYASQAKGGADFPSLDGRNGRPNALFRNVSDAAGGRARFEDVSVAAGVASTGWTLAVGAFDYDGDGDGDLYLANDFGPDELYRNDGRGRFTDVSAALGVDDRGSGMNASFVDFDRDGRWDIYVSTIDMFSKNIGFKFPAPSDTIKFNDRIIATTLYVSGNKLLRNRGGQGGFEPIEDRVIEPGENGWSWGALFFDAENDGDDDLYLTNGWAPRTAAHAQRNQLLRAHAGRLFRGDPQAPEAYEGDTRGAVAVDLRGDGRVDLLNLDFDAGPRLLANAALVGRGAWLKVRLRGAGANTRGVGAVVRLAVRGQPTRLRQVSAGHAYLGQDDTTLHFGLGEARAFEALEVVWPGGATQRLKGGALNRTLEVVQATP